MAGCFIFTFLYKALTRGGSPNLILDKDGSAEQEPLMAQLPDKTVSEAVTDHPNKAMQMVQPPFPKKYNRGSFASVIVSIP